ncbi:MAG TPA: GntP family permease [Candidatus Binatia bacterium]|nr:GntP family permease [Candidatus Binatia bacterium]
MGLVGILLGLGLLMWLAYRGWSVLLAAPAAALLAAGISSEPLLAHWTQTFMGGTARFVSQWFPMFLLGGLFGKLMEDSRSISAIARSLTERLGTKRTMLAVVLASAVVTYGGVSVFVAFFVLVPMADDMFRTANLPRRLMPAAIGLGAFTFTMSAMPGTPSVNNAIPMPYFGTTAFAAPGIGLTASAIIMILGMWWLHRAESKARQAGDGYKPRDGASGAADSTATTDEKLRGHATAAGDFDPAELEHGKLAESEPTFFLAALPLAVVITMNFLMSLVVLPRLDFSFLADEAWGGTTFRALAGIWSVVLALAAGCLTVVIVNWRRLPDLRQSLDAGANASVLPLLTVSSLVGFGAVVGALPAFATVRDAVLSIQGGPLISLTIAMNALAGLTGTASGGMAIALNVLGEHYMTLAREYGINPELLHRITTLSAGTLDALPHNGTVLILLKLCGLTHGESYFDMVMTVIVTCIIALVAVLFLGSVFGSF